MNLFWPIVNKPTKQRPINRGYQVDTGGTVGSKNKGKEGSATPSRSANLAGFVQRVDDIKVEETFYPYPKPILSENITFVELKLLIRQLIDIIVSKDMRHDGINRIVVTHGTDSMDKVVDILDYPIEERVCAVDEHYNADGSYSTTLKVDTLDDELYELVSQYQKLVHDRGIHVIFTGSNTTKKAEKKANIEGAYRVDLNKTPSGTYIFFHGDLIEGQYAVKDVYDKNIQGMRYTHNGNDVYRQRIQEQKQRDETIKKALSELPDSKNFNRLALEYDATTIKRNHNELRQRLADSDTRAVILVLYHGGTANTKTKKYPKESVEKLVLDMRKENPNLVFFAVSENFEPVDLTKYETSVDLRKAGVVPLYDMSRNVALAKLQMMDLSKMDNEQIIDGMLRNRVGEIKQKPKRKHIRKLKKLYRQDEPIGTRPRSSLARALAARFNLN